MIMTIKTFIYFIIIPLVILALDSINIKGVFKKNKTFQAKMLFGFIAMALSYLIVNFLFDVFTFYA